MRTLQQISDRDAEQRLVRALTGHGGRLTRSDATALTGLPAERAESALTAMLRTYRSHLAATDAGELLYSFDPAMTRRDAEPLRARLARLGAWLWRGFVFAFKIAIITALVVYFLLFLALLVGLLVMRLSSDRDDHRGDDDGGFFPIGIIWWMLPWDVRPPARYGAYGRPARARRRPSKKVYQQVFDFVFGPPRPAPAPGAADREVLAYLRAQRGRVTAAELCALTGRDLAAAEEEATRLMCEYGGEPEVTDDGVVVYVFRDMRKTAAATTGAWTYAWERLEPRPALTGNSPGTDAVVAILNGFNLAAPVLFVPAAFARLGLGGDATAELWLRVVPFVFSALFFAVPLGRALARAAREPGRRHRNRQRLLLREVFAGAPGRQLHEPLPLAPDAVARVIGRGDPVEQKLVARDLRALAPALGGDVGLAERDLGRLTFPRLAEELAAVAHARAAAPAAEADVGEVVFDSAGALDEPPGRGPGGPRRLPQ
ncbi:MAG TPA: hypothetical protein VGQ83_37750 [Polyangia bacterium]|jgi:hypothetical protein